MNVAFDSVIIGGGPAAVSAALTLRNRNKTVAIVTGGVDDIPLSRSHKITNYPGMPDISGRDMLEAMERQAAEAGAEIIRGRATSVLNMGASFGVAVGNDFTEGKTVILCTGVRPAKLFPGEKELLGKGVSYCVTCDGILYRGRDVCLVGFTSDTEEHSPATPYSSCALPPRPTRCLRAWRWTARTSRRGRTSPRRCRACLPRATVWAPRIRWPRP